MKKVFEKPVECKSCGQVTDNDKFDYTEQATPAWWRGHEAGMKDAADKILEVLDFKWDGSGVLDVPCLDALRIRIRQLQNAYEREALKVTRCSDATEERADALSEGQLGWSRAYRDVEDLRKERDKFREQFREVMGELAKK